ncbi:helix-turn-helix domain-containing protein, partial [Methylobacterium iners]|uniref:helix-turn-helix domain-containing protein n=1 Tax=Methylobacterium iners TaxID=418707 RepID=UPI001EE2A6AB
RAAGGRLADFISTAEIAALRKISKPSAARWAHRNGIAHKVGQNVFVHVDDLERPLPARPRVRGRSKV